MRTAQGTLSDVEIPGLNIEKSQRPLPINNNHQKKGNDTV